MKKHLLYYNRLVKRFNKYQRKLNRVDNSPYHYKRVDVLIKRVKALHEQIQKLGMALKGAAAGGAIALSMMLAPIGVDAQDFTLQSSIPTGFAHAENFSVPVFTDLDADGDLDLVVGERYGSLFVWTNEGGEFVYNDNSALSGIFINDSIHEGDDNGAYLAPAFSDYDQDGDEDLFIGTVEGKVRFYENDGGVFTNKTGADNPLDAFGDGDYTKPTFADLDGDGDMDAIIGKGNGEMQYWVSAPTEATVDWESIEVYGSVDDDGTGLAWEYSGSWASKQGDVWVNGALECTNGAALNATSNCPYPIAPATGNNSSSPLTMQGILCFQNDVDGDGDSGGASNRDRAIHLVANQDIADLSLFALGIPNNGGGSDSTEIYLPQMSVTAGQNILVVRDEDSTAIETYFGDEWSQFDHVILDGGINFNGDDGVELFSAIIGEGPNGFTKADNNPLGSFFTDDNEDQNRAAPAFADLDGDGDLDAYIGNKGGDAGGEILFLENTGTATAPVFEQNDEANPFAGFLVSSDAAPTFADIDADGDLDAFVGHLNGPVDYFENDGGAFTVVEANDIGLYDVGDGASPSMADVDEDGDMDILIGKNDGVKFFENTDGVYSELLDENNPFDFVSDAIPDSASLYNPEFVDWNGDGYTDLFVTLNEGPIFYFQNNADGTYSDMSFSDDNPLNGYPTVGEESVAFMDYDGDGDLDCFIGNKDGDIKYLSNDGGTLTEAAGPFDDVDFGGNILYPAFYDFDRDGDQDAFIGKEDGTIRYFENSGSGFTEVTGDGNPFDDVKMVVKASPAFGDVDGDGVQDVVMSDRAGKSWFFKGSGTAVPPTVANAIADQEVRIDNEFTLVVEESVFSDANNDIVVYRAKQANGSELPAWLSFDRVSRTLTGTPSAANIGTVNVSITAVDADNNSVASEFALVVRDAVPLASPSMSSEISIYPNPTSDQIKVVTNFEKTQSIELYSITGAKLETIQVQGAETNISMADLPKGVYVVRVIGSDGTVLRRVIKK